MSTILVGLLTIEQKGSLVGQMYDEDSFFNPITDLDDQWIISVEEINQCVNPDFIWVKTLPLIEYVPKPAPPLR
jgi:hypothetical protein